jgi:LPXTG-motif cell wall-anchored protein
MSLTRRLAAGLPAAGVAAFAVLAFAGSPASAASPDTAGAAGRPAVMVSPTCSDGPRSKCGYSNGGGSTPDNNGTAPAGATTPAADDNGSGNGSGNGDDDRGHPGYGNVSPTTSPPVTPSAGTDTVPPGGVSPTTASPSATPGGGVSAGSTLPLTGAPAGLTVGFGALLVAAGAGAIWYTRRRRSA